MIDKVFNPNPDGVKEEPESTEEDIFAEQTELAEQPQLQHNVLQLQRANEAKSKIDMILSANENYEKNTTASNGLKQVKALIDSGDTEAAINLANTLSEKYPNMDIEIVASILQGTYVEHKPIDGIDIIDTDKLRRTQVTESDG